MPRSAPGARLAPTSSWLAFSRSLAARPQTVTRRGAELARTMTEIAVGSPAWPGQARSRFADPAGQENPVLRRAVQAYLAHHRGDPGRVAEGRDRAARQLVAALRPVARPRSGGEQDAPDALGGTGLILRARNRGRLAL